VAIALVAGGAAGFVTAFAHHIVSTSPVPAVGVVDTTPLADSAIVYADNTRHIEFFLWAPNTCGLAGAAPVWSDSEPVTTATLTNSTVTSATVVPHEVGTYEWTAEVVVTAGGAVENGPTACGDEPVTVNRAGSSITTDQSNAGGAMIGTSLVDTATVTGDHPSGTVTFSIFGPNDATCANSALESWATQLGANGKASVPGPGYATTQVGTYQWVAHYGGDANNAPATSACGTEAVTIAKGTPTITTDASAGGPVGVQIHDTAQVSGGDNPTGTVTFSLYSPSNAGCVNNSDSGLGSLQSWTVALGQDGSAVVPNPGYTTTQVGTYQWVAHYSGDANNMSVTSACGTETVTVGKASPRITTKASEGGPVGAQIDDTALVTGGDSPTGTVTFYLFSPDNATCANNSGETWLQSWTVALHSDGKASVPNPGYTTAETGTYQWVAQYSGDANNKSATSECGTEAVTIGKDSPTIATVASDGGPVGSQIHDTSQVSGGDNPTGTVSFFLYAPNNATCSNADDAPGFVQKVTVPLGADGSASGAGTPFTTTAVGTYHWIATYSGDANNGGATSGCSDEAVVVTKDGTTISTTPSAGGATGTKISDVAKVAGGLSATGTVTFNLYAPSDPKCSGTPIYTGAAALDANGTASSGMFTATANAGTYNWIATYGGDANNAGVSGRCGQEPVVIVAGGVQGITTGVPGTGSAESLGEIGLGAELVLLGIALGLGAELLRERRRV
jgi:Bacterial Ig-like domain (group 3)